MTKSINGTDYLIVGAGIIGLSLARELLSRKPGASIVIIEKEGEVASHASGRNSGVLHAGFYYTADSLKARFSVDGNKAMRTFCEERNIPVNRCGKVVVTRAESELSMLHELERRGKANGVQVSLIDEKELAEIEPVAKTIGQALYCPTTATVPPLQVCKAIADEIERAGVKILFNTRLLRVVGNVAFSETRRIEFDHLINCAGLYADRIAAMFGIGRDYLLLPFKGIYFQLLDQSAPVKTNIYPVPDVLNPFLGVHYTVKVDGTVKIGPTAIPGLWREHYQGFGRFSLPELLETLGGYGGVWLGNSFGFRSLALREMRKYDKRVMVGEAAKLVRTFDGRQEAMPAGIRAQLYDRKKKALVNDFVVDKAEHSTHVLNAVSPAFTCSFPFAAHVVDGLVEI